MTHRAVRHLARATAASAGFAIGAVILEMPALGVLAACVAIALTLTLLLHLFRHQKGNR